MNHLTFLLAIAPLAATAQAGLSPQPAHLKAAADFGKVYTYVERMPQLPGGGGMGAIVLAFQKRLLAPVQVRDGNYGKAFVYFEVSTTGAVQNVRLKQSSRLAQLDSAIVAAVKALPKFVPGYQNGRPVTVSLTIPIACIKSQ